MLAPKPCLLNLDAVLGRSRIAVALASENGESPGSPINVRLLGSHRRGLVTLRSGGVARTCRFQYGLR